MIVRLSKIKKLLVAYLIVYIYYTCVNLLIFVLFFVIHIILYRLREYIVEMCYYTMFNIFICFEVILFS